MSGKYAASNSRKQYISVASDPILIVGGVQKVVPARGEATYKEEGLCTKIFLKGSDVISPSCQAAKKKVAPDPVFH